MSLSAQFVPCKISMIYNCKNSYLSVSIVMLFVFLFGITFHNEPLTQFHFSKLEPADTIDEFPPYSCDIFDGNWVFDESTHPLYKEDECHFLTNQVLFSFFLFFSINYLRNRGTRFLNRCHVSTSGHLLCVATLETLGLAYVT